MYGRVPYSIVLHFPKSQQQIDRLNYFATSAFESSVSVSSSIAILIIIPSKKDCRQLIAVLLKLLCCGSRESSAVAVAVAVLWKPIVGNNNATRTTTRTTIQTSLGPSRIEKQR